MDSPPPCEPEPAAAPETIAKPGGRVASWIALVGLATIPAWIIAIFLFTFALKWLGVRGDLYFHLIVLVPLIGTILAAIAIARTGLRNDWQARLPLRLIWGLAALAVVVAGAIVYQAFQTVRRSSLSKAAISNLRQPSAAMDQFILESGPYRIFVDRDELIGPDRYVKAINPVENEDYGPMFPMRRDQAYTATVILPDGRETQRTEYLSVTLTDGTLVTYPRPDDPEGRKQDGVHTIKLSDGRYYKVTYRGGVPDGPFSAYYPDGKLWGEATYDRGRVVGPSWLYTRDGRRLDERAERDQANQALLDAAEAATRDRKILGRERIRAGDPAGAIQVLTAAIELNPTDLELYRLRGDARKATGDLDGAIHDYCLGENIVPEYMEQYQLPDHLRQAVTERVRGRKAAVEPGPLAGDLKAIAQSAFWKAEEFIRSRAYADAESTLGSALELAPVAENHGLRADARRHLRDFPGAAADYTRAIELAAGQTMLLPPNQRRSIAEWRYRRGHVRRWSGDLAGAADDFRAAIGILGTASRPNDCNAAAWLNVVQREQGLAGPAARELAALDKSDWPERERELARFLSDEMTEAQLDASAAAGRRPEDLFRAAYFGAVLRRIAGDHAGALERFKRALATGDSYNEFERADAALLVAAGEKVAAAKEEPSRPQPAKPTSPGPAQPATPGTPGTPPPAHVGLRRFHSHDYSGAIAAFSEDIAARPGNLNSVLYRAECHRALGDAAAAVADYTTVIGRAPRHSTLVSQGLYGRGHTRRLHDDPAGALEDFRALLASPSPGNAVIFRDAAFWIFLLTRNADPERAAAELSATARILAEKTRWSDWNTRLVEFLLGRLSEEKLLEAIDPADKRGLGARQLDAHFFAALQCRHAGDTAAALKHLRKAMALPHTRQPAFTAREEAQRLIKELESQTAPP